MKKIQSILQNKTAGCLAAWLLTFALITSLMAGTGCIRPKTAQAAGDSQVILHNPTYDSNVHEVTPGAVSAAGNIHNPVYNADMDETTWDCVWFGNYWQSDTNGDGVADKNDAKEPIKWRVLSVDGDDVFLLADKNLDAKPYNETYNNDMTWETCTMRSWLNGYGSADNVCGVDYAGDNFIDTAFSAAEQAAIKTTDVDNEDNPNYGTEGGNNTLDKIYLLSIAEASNAAYGFDSESGEDSNTREALNTAYVAARDEEMHAADEADGFWLRSPGKYGSLAAFVNYYCSQSGDTVH